jgi:hypothetical protein
MFAANRIDWGTDLRRMSKIFRIAGPEIGK